MSTALRFREAVGPQPGGAVRLRFGYIGEPPVIPPPAGLRAWVSAPWRTAAPLAAQVAAPWRAAGRLGPAWLAAPWSSLGAVAPARFRSPWGDAGRLPPAWTASAWRDTLLTRSAWAAPWHSGIPLLASVAAPWRQALPAAGRVRSPWGAGRAHHQRTRAPWQSGKPSTVRLAAPFGFSVLSIEWLRAPWNDGTRVTSYGGPWVPPIVPVVPVVPCYMPLAGGAVALVFRSDLLTITRLIFSCNHGTATIRVPIRRVYMVTNTATLTRVDGGVNIPCFSLALNLDRGSWAWGFSAALPASAMSLIEPTVAGQPVELEAVVNGMAIRLIAESMSRERLFNQAAVRVQGRGKTAVLDAPYSPIVTFNNASAALTHQQLLDAALPAGWTADYGLTAWLVPAGVWSHQGTTMTAALALAAAGGAYIQPHPTANQIRVLPHYPVAPWGWSGVTPDFELPSAVVTREGIEWAEKARYNGVFVAAPAVGKAYLVKRTGTAGDVLAPMVTDPLATHVDAGRQRGLPIVADVGRQARVSLRLPVLPATSIIQPGKFVRYIDGAVTRLGLNRSVGVEVVWGNNEALQVWQTIGVETHVL